DPGRAVRSHRVGRWRHGAGRRPGRGRAAASFRARRGIRRAGGCRLMFPVFDHVPGYPIVFVLFWGAAAIFALAMARHLRVFEATRPAVAQPRPFAQVGRRFVGLIEYAFIQTKMFKDARAGLMHAGIFWGFVLLTIGTANIVTGGVIQTVLSVP